MNLEEIINNYLYYKEGRKTREIRVEDLMFDIIYILEQIGFSIYNEGTIKAAKIVYMICAYLRINSNLINEEDLYNKIFNQTTIINEFLNDNKIVEAFNDMDLTYANDKLFESIYSNSTGELKNVLYNVAKYIFNRVDKECLPVIPYTPVKTK